MLFQSSPWQWLGCPKAWVSCSLSVQRGGCVKCAAHCGFVLCTDTPPWATFDRQGLQLQCRLVGEYLVLVFPWFRFAVAVVLLAITRVFCGGKKRKVNLNFRIVFKEKIWQTAFTSYKVEGVLIGFRFVFGKMTESETDYFNCVCVSEYLEVLWKW